MSRDFVPLHRVIPIVRAESLIPEGMYCYTPLEVPSEANGFSFKVKPCPFWRLIEGEQEGGEPVSGGYCEYLKAGDLNEDGTMLLWDQVKECGIKREEYEDL